MNQKLKKFYGQALIEVMIAIFIISITVYVFKDYFGSGIKAYTFYRSKTEATILCQQKLEELIGMGYEKLLNLPFSFKEGKRVYPAEKEKIGGEKSPYKWQMDLESISGYPNLKKINLKVLWSLKGEQKEVILSTYISKH